MREHDCFQVREHSRRKGDVLREKGRAFDSGTRYYRASAAKRIFSAADHHLHNQLYGWARWRHPRKSGGWRYRRYWRQQGTRQVFGDGASTLARHDDTPIVRHVKVQGDKSPYNGDWVYWGERLQRDPTKPPRVLRLLIGCSLPANTAWPL
jgi:RNA-directed DNA polymerase